nr:hypothetical protein [Paraburkholderia ribeironis]
MPAAVARSQLAVQVNPPQMKVLEGRRPFQPGFAMR